MMIIRLLPDGHEGTRQWLVGTPGKTTREHTASSGEERSVPRKQTVTDGSGWDNKQFYDRGNSHVELTVSTTRLFTSKLACWRWRNSLSRKATSEQPHAWSGDIVLRELLADGTWAEEIIRGAVVMVAGMRPMGLSLMLTYNIKGPCTEDYHTGSTAAVITPALGPAPAAVVVAGGRKVIAEKLS